MLSQNLTQNCKNNQIIEYFIFKHFKLIIYLTPIIRLRLMMVRSQLEVAEK